jgi:outer membrane protein TolC
MRRSTLPRLAYRHGGWLAALLLFSLGPLRAAPGEAAADGATSNGSPRLTLPECIAIALRNQPTIHARQAALGAAGEQQKVARSYFLPQVGFTSRWYLLDKPLDEEFPSPFSGLLGNLLAEDAAFFGIARAAGGAAALQALSHPNLPPFRAAQQAALSALPSGFTTEVFGQSLLFNQVLATQPLYTGGKIRYRNQQAGLGVQAAGAQVVQSRQQTAFEVSRAYYGILLARELVRVIDDTAGRYRAVERLVNSLLEEGDENVTTADLARFRALRVSAESQKVEFQRAVDLARAALRQAMGLDPQAPVAPADERLEFRPVALELPALTAQALSRRPELIQAEIGVKNAVLEEKLAAAAFCPNVGLYGSFNTLSGQRTFPNPHEGEEWAAGISAEVPLFTGCRRLAERRKAGYQIQQAQETLQSARSLVTLEVEKVYLQYTEMAERVPLAEAAVRGARAALKAYDDQYVGGLVAEKDYPKYFENVVTTRLLLTLAEVQYYQQLYAYNLALAAIRRVTAADD